MAAVGGNNRPVWLVRHLLEAHGVALAALRRHNQATKWCAQCVVCIGGSRKAVSDAAGANPRKSLSKCEKRILPFLLL